MQNPLGADVLTKNPEAMDAVGALFKNPAWPVMTIHSTFSAYATTAFAVAGVYAWSALRGKLDDMRRAGVAIALVVGTLSALAMPITGDAAAKSVALRQPTKLAAMEAQFATEQGAPLRLGGWPDPETKTVRFALELPKMLSLMAFSDPNAEVKGLDAAPRELWPDVHVTHVAFQLMVASGMALLLIAAGYWFPVIRRRRQELNNRLLLWLLVASGFLGIIALEAGWVVTEVGRQPWIIYGVMKVAAAVTTAPGLLSTLSGFVALYALLGVALVYLLNRLKHA
jgi:cytochrome d ubiquinol oxidase subunit I